MLLSGNRSVCVCVSALARPGLLGLSLCLVSPASAHDASNTSADRFTTHGALTALGNLDQVVGVGDVDADGFGDFVLVRNASTSARAGSVADLFLGQEDGPNLAARQWRHTPSRPTTWVRAAGAGDIDGDGYSDVLVWEGGIGTGLAGEDKHRLHLYRGSASGLLPAPSWTRATSKPHHYLGEVPAAAGDFDGDGYGDVLVGSPRFDKGLTDHDEGRLELYRGSPNGLPWAPDWTRTGLVPKERLGATIATLGDVDGDGYGDFAVSSAAPLLTDSSGVEVAAGTLEIYLGKPGPIGDPTPARAFTGTLSERYTGVVAPAGDVDGDGLADVLLQTVRSDARGGLVRRVALYPGASFGVLAPHPTWYREASDGLGHRVQGLSDMNGDGFSDFVVSSYLDVTGPEHHGRAAVYLGGPDGPIEPPALVVTGDAQLYRVGRHLAAPGDLDGDGFADLLLGARTSGGVDRVTLYAGGPSNLGEPLEIVPPAPARGMGVSIANAGDIDGDGYDDVIVGADRHNAGAGEVGAAFVYRGTADGLEPEPFATIDGEQPGERLGAAVAGVGDVDGDGLTDVLVGSPGYDRLGMLDAGRAQLFRGGPDGLVLAWDAGGLAAAERFGATVTWARDMTGDGLSDVAIGAPGASYVAVYHGVAGVGLSHHASWALHGEPGSQLGHAIASGDATGDGLADLLVGAPGSGRVELWRAAGYGHATEPDWSWSGAGAAGSAVELVDLDGDGIANALVGAPEHDGVGAVHHFLDLASYAVPATRLGESPGARFGAAIASLGDCDDHGLPEIAVGAPGAGAGGVGRVLVFGGEATLPLDGAPIYTREGAVAGAGLGTVLAGADLDGDGLGDLLMGAPDYRRGAIEGIALHARANTAYVSARVLPAVPRLLRAFGKGGSMLVAPPWSRLPTELVIGGVVARGAEGRRRLALDIEGRFDAVPFDGLGTWMAGAGSPPAPGSIQWREGAVDGQLLLDYWPSNGHDRPYHVRVQVRYDPSQAPIQARSRRFVMGDGPAPHGLHVRLACRGDADVDGLCDARDRCPLTADGANLDSDGDGLGDVCDPCAWDQAPPLPDGTCGLTAEGPSLDGALPLPPGAWIDSMAADEGVAVAIPAPVSPDPTTPYVKYWWDLEADGSFSPAVPDAETQLVTFPDDGPHGIVVAVDDAAGTRRVGTLTVVVANLPPVVEAGHDRVVLVGHAVVLDGSLSDAPGDVPDLMSAWDLGDGSGGSGPSLTYVYAQPGVYTATLAASDGDGGHGEDVTKVHVLETAFATRPLTVVEAGKSYIDGIELAVPPLAPCDLKVLGPAGMLLNNGENVVWPTTEADAGSEVEARVVVSCPLLGLEETRIWRIRVVAERVALYPDAECLSDLIDGLAVPEGGLAIDVQCGETAPGQCPASLHVIGTQAAPDRPLIIHGDCEEAPPRLLGSIAISDPAVTLEELELAEVGQGVIVYASYARLVGTTVHGCDAGPPGAGAALQLLGGAGSFVADNRIFGCPVGVRITGGSAGARLLHNTLVDVGSGPALTHAVSFEGAPEGVKVIGNILMATGGPVYHMDWAPPGLVSNHNLLIGFFVSDLEGSMTFDDWTFVADGESAALEAPELWKVFVATDPMQPGFLRLCAGSPADGLAVPVPGVTTDWSGKPRDPWAPDAGAHER